VSLPPPGPLAGRRLYLCTPDRPDLEDFLEACIRGGVDVIQLRDKRLEARPLLERARVAARCCAAQGVPFIVNDRPDIALECGATGVHVGQDDVPVSLARRLLGPHAVVGLSTHAPAELEASRSAAVDYISAGPVEPTPTKPGRAGTGTAYVRLAADTSPHPVFVTGGVRPETVPQLVAAGARRFVVVRHLTESNDAEGDALRLAEAIDQALCGVR
jgi:thiamine-phosphate pyrophosphorylase